MHLLFSVVFLIKSTHACIIRPPINHTDGKLPAINEDQIGLDTQYYCRRTEIGVLHSQSDGKIQPLLVKPAEYKSHRLRSVLFPRIARICNSNHSSKIRPACISFISPISIVHYICINTSQTPNLNVNKIARLFNIRPKL